MALLGLILETEFRLNIDSVKSHVIAQFYFCQKEIEKLDSEITTVADTCSNREQILQQKMEKAMEEARHERMLANNIKADMLQIGMSTGQT